LKHNKHNQKISPKSGRRRRNPPSRNPHWVVQHSDHNPINSNRFNSEFDADGQDIWKPEITILRLRVFFFIHSHTRIVETTKKKPKKKPISMAQQLKMDHRDREGLKSANFEINQLVEINETRSSIF